MGIFYPVRIPRDTPKSNRPFDDKGNELSRPVPGHPDWAKKKKKKKTLLSKEPVNPVNKNG
mgnify:CR=1 FL=1